MFSFSFLLHFKLFFKFPTGSVPKPPSGDFRPLGGRVFVTPTYDHSQRHQRVMDLGRSLLS